MEARAALAQWLEHLEQERRLSPRTLAAYGFIGRRYLTFLEGHRGGPLTAEDLGGISAAEIRAWLAVLRQGETPLSPRSLSQSLSAIRTFHGFLDRRLGIANPALALVRGPRVRPSAPRPVTESQAAELLAEPGLDANLDPWESSRDEAVLTSPLLRKSEDRPAPAVIRPSARSARSDSRTSRGDVSVSASRMSW